MVRCACFWVQVNPVNWLVLCRWFQSKVSDSASYRGMYCTWSAHLTILSTTMHINTTLQSLCSHARIMKSTTYNFGWMYTLNYKTRLNIYWTSDEIYIFQFKPMINTYNHCYGGSSDEFCGYWHQRRRRGKWPETEVRRLSEGRRRIPELVVSSQLVPERCCQTFPMSFEPALTEM